VKVWDVLADGSLANRRTLCAGAEPTDTGWLDGMECDELGNVWTTAPDGIWVIDPGGKRIGVVATPEPLGSLVWGGDDRRLLFLASSTTIHVLPTLVAGARLPGDSAAR
jgi:gluconolactonase